MQRNWRRWLTAAALATVVPLTGAAECDDTTAKVVITYQQLGACKDFRDGTGEPVDAGTGGVFVIFRVTSVANSHAERYFLFQPDRLYINGYPDDPAVGYYTLGWDPPKPLPGLLIPPGRTEEPWGTAMVKLTFPGDLDPLGAGRNWPYHLGYHTPPDSLGVLLVKDRANSEKKTWAETYGCKDIQGLLGQGSV
jgi:hypothetical protein